MLSSETKKYLAKAMSLAQSDSHELVILSFSQESGEVEVLSAMMNSTPEAIAILAREALNMMAEKDPTVN